MVKEFQAAATPSLNLSPLTDGLVRNTAFNLVGWLWPIGLSVLTIPYIVTKMGNTAFGIFSIVSIVAGYLGLLNGPVTMGNVRFMAEAYAREEWSELRRLAIGGLLINGALSALGSLLMFLSANVLARRVFQIPVPLVEITIISLRLAAVSFFLNGLVGALQSIPIATRRFDIRNKVGLVVGTLNTVGIIAALWWGWGLLGAVMAQVFSSALALALFAIVALRLLRKFPGSGDGLRVRHAFVKRLTTFSSLLFAGQVTSQIGLQIDRALVGILLGPSAVTLYTVPTRITDKIPGMMQVFSATLYPLSSEAVATNRLEELQDLYHETVRILLWLSAFFAAPLLILSKEILALWIDQAFMVDSWLVLTLLAAGVIWRSSGSVAYQVCNGLGRADINLAASIGTAVFVIFPLVILAPRFGTPGIALGAFIGLFISNVLYDLFTQRRVLGGKSWRQSLTPYVRIILALAGTFISVRLFPLQVTNWVSLLIKAGLISFLYLGFTLAVGALRTRDIRFIKAKLVDIVKRVPLATTARG